MDSALNPSIEAMKSRDLLASTTTISLTPFSLSPKQRERPILPYPTTNTGLKTDQLGTKEGTCANITLATITFSVILHDSYATDLNLDDTL
ncbi:hypothetical protein D3C72_2169430 [compost metagenome]